MLDRISACSADFVVLEFAFPKDELWPVAVLLLDTSGQLHVRARTDLASRLDPGDAEVVSGFINDLSSDAREIGGADVLSRLHDRMSNSIRITDPVPVQTQTIESAMEDLAVRYLLGDKRLRLII
jgi:hypothetical protein